MNILKDAKGLQLKCGLEIHQQLEGRKLFCSSPTTIRDDTPSFVFKRFLRASAGESGVIDKAALAEMKKKKYYLYEGYYDSTGLVEADEEPPEDVSVEALDASLSIAKLFSMTIIDEIRFMRKTVVNGSNTSGFQRTGLIAVNGELRTEEGLVVGVESACLEEDACKEVETTSKYTKYNLSRLGIPLIEIATAPDIKKPEDVQIVAEHIGMVLRSLSNVKRGLGTIRQDVNISIPKGVRVEIKGAQDLKKLPVLAQNEMLRQHNLLEIFDELKKRNARVDKKDGKFIFNPIKSLERSQSKVIRSALDADGVVVAGKLFGYGGLTGIEICPGRRYGSELSDYAKVMGVKGLFHSDELPNYGISQDEKDAVFDELGLDKTKDAFIIIASEKNRAVAAMKEAMQRANDLTLRKEVRAAKPDGTSQYMRPMPGAARMYPETDVKPIRVDKENIFVPKLLSEKINELSKEFGIAQDVAKKLLKDGIDLTSLSKKYSHVKPLFIVDLFFSVPSIIKKKEGIDVTIDRYANELLEKVNAGDITKDSVIEVVTKLCKGESFDYADYKPVSLTDAKQDITQIVQSMKGAPTGAIMGKVMAKYKGKIDGKELMKLVQSLI